MGNGTSDGERHVSRNFAWQKGFWPQVERVVGSLFAAESTPAQDWYRATDLVVLSAGPWDVAVRLRRAKWLRHDDAPDEVTVTWEHDDGRRCEGPKICIDGMADLFFYGFVSDNNPRVGRIVRWRIIDLSLTREYLFQKRGYLRPNDAPVGSRSWWSAYHVDKIADACGAQAFIDFRPRWPGDISPRPKYLESQRTIEEEMAYDPDLNPADPRQLTEIRGLAEQPGWGDRADGIRARVERVLATPLSRHGADLFIANLRRTLYGETPR